MNDSNQLAVLLHMHVWRSILNEFEIDKDIWLKSTNNSKIWELYVDMCEKFNYDQGEPFGYDFYIQVKVDYPWDPTDPFSITGKISNLISIELEMPIAASRSIYSSDNFNTFIYTSEDYQYGNNTEWLMFDDIKNEKRYFDDLSLTNVKKMYLSLKEIDSKNVSKNRIINALIYYFYSWCRIHYLEQTCINLSVCLESLFAPISNTELSHQISYNISRFLTDIPDERRKYYTLIKKFYNLRSKIVHGNVPNTDEVINLTREVYVLTGKIIKRILLDEKLTSIFNNEKMRVNFFREMIFK